MEPWNNLWKLSGGAERIRTAERVRSGTESDAFKPMLSTPQTLAGRWPERSGNVAGSGFATRKPRFPPPPRRFMAGVLGTE
jgi:hypothetical protein